MLTKKNAKLLSDNHIVKTMGIKCCTYDCLGSLGRTTIYDLRASNSNRNEAEKSTLLIHYCRNHFQARNSGPRVLFQINDTPCCRTAFLRAYGFSERKFNRCRQAALNNTIEAPVHGNSGVVKATTKFAHANAWFATYCEFNGNLEPSGEIHLCIYNRWVDVYNMYIADCTDKDLQYTYGSFRQMIKLHYKHVKKPKKTNLPQCDTCSELAQRRIKCKNQIEREQLISEMRAHSLAHQAERNEYHKRIAQAVANPDTFLSIIIDNATHRLFPHRCKYPKMFVGETRLEIGTIGLMDHGNKIRKLLQTLPVYPHDCNLVLTVLHEHIQELAAMKALPPILYLQFDNCFKENKNNIIFAYMGLLVHHRIFRSVVLSYLIPGHTHTDIDQMHSTWEKWMVMHDCNTPLALSEQCDSIYTNKETRPIIKFQDRVLNFKAWLEGNAMEFSFHSKLRAFKFEQGLMSQQPECWYKRTQAFDTNWHGPDPKNTQEGYRVIFTFPKDEPQILAAKELEQDVCKSLSKFYSLLNDEEQGWYTNLIEKKGAIFATREYVYKIKVAHDEPSETEASDEHTPILRVQAPTQRNEANSGKIMPDKQDEIIFCKENELCIALVTTRVKDNIVRARLYEIEEQNVVDESENVFVLSKQVVHVNLNQVKLAGKILTQKNYIYKRIWPKFKAWQAELAVAQQ